jgi:hypothetical protein
MVALALKGPSQRTIWSLINSAVSLSELDICSSGSSKVACEEIIVGITNRVKGMGSYLSGSHSGPNLYPLRIMVVTLMD